MMVNDLFMAVFLRLQAPQPQANQVLHFGILGVDVSHEHEGEVGRVGKPRFIDSERLIEVHSAEEVRVVQRGTLRVVGTHYLDRVAKGVLRVLIAIEQLVLEQAHQCLVRLFVMPGRCEIQVGQLEHRLKVLYGRRAMHPLNYLRYLRMNGDRFACEGFLELCTIEATDTGKVHN